MEDNVLSVGGVETAVVTPTEGSTTPVEAVEVPVTEEVAVEAVSPATEAPTA